MLEGQNGNGECTSEKVAKIKAFRYLPPHFHNGKIEVMVGATIRERFNWKSENIRLPRTSKD